VAADDFATASDGVRLSVRVNGRGEQSLIVPGIGAEMDFGNLCTARRVAFFDIRNRGRSDPVPVEGSVGVPVEIDDIDTVRTHVGFATASILGWSYVGLVSALYAARYPQHVERLVMVCPSPPSASLQPMSADADPVLVQRLHELAESPLASTDPVAFAREWRRIVIPTRMGDPTSFETLRADPSIWPNEWPEHMTDALERVFATHPVDFDYRPEAQRISAPTLIIHGDLDTIPHAASEQWTRVIPNARLLVLPGIGHFPHVEAPSAFFDAVQTFLDGDWPAHTRDLPT
jgi:pimeloyl-ACP methyl ester carboxylesterase